MKNAARKEAQELRRKGFSIKHIASRLHVSLSTASRWCKNIQLTKNQIKKLTTRRREAGLSALKPWIELRTTEKEQDIILQKKIGTKDVGTMSQRDLFMLGLGLYWGEGYKRGSQELGFTNSNLEIIKIYLKWLESFYNVNKDRLIARVTINNNYKSQEKRILNYWSKNTDIPLQQFTKSSLITSTNNSEIRPEETYYGTLRIKVRNGTSLRRRILGSIASVQG